MLLCKESAATCAVSAASAVSAGAWIYLAARNEDTKEGRPVATVVPTRMLQWSPHVRYSSADMYATLGHL